MTTALLQIDVLHCTNNGFVGRTSWLFDQSVLPDRMMKPSNHCPCANIAHYFLRHSLGFIECGAGATPCLGHPHPFVYNASCDNGIDTDSTFHCRSSSDNSEQSQYKASRHIGCVLKLPENEGPALSARNSFSWHILGRRGPFQPAAPTPTWSMVEVRTRKSRR